MSDKNSLNNSRLSGASSPEAPPTSNGHTPTIKQPFSMDNSSGATITKNNANSGTGDNKPRRSSPESDAVASSDEESEQRKLGLAPPSLGGISQLSSRRPSYAAEFHTRQRPYSLSGNGAPLSPTTSHPNTPGDTVWAPGVSPNPGHGTASGNASLSPFWGGGSIWNQEPSRKSPPKSLNVAPPMGGGSNPSPLFAGSEALPSPTSLPTNNNGEFPLAIPLQPQFRTYRSMSFSVGQNDTEDQNRTRLSPPAMPLGGGGGGGGSRPPQTKGLQHRPSRPSLLSEEQFPGSSSPLRSVFETEDDEAMKASESAQIQAAGNYYQAQMAIYSRSKYDAMRLRNRSASAATIPTLNLGLGPGFGPKDSDRIDEYESALAEEDDPEYAQFHAEQRRFSEVPRAMSLMYTPAETQRLEMLRRQHWASNGAFGQPDLGTQSRRHSFAGGLPMAEQEPEFGLGSSDLLGKRTENGMGLGSRDALYFNDENRLRTRQSFSHASSSALGPSPGTPPNQHHMQHMQSYALSGRNSPPNRSMMGLPLHTQTRSQQLLYFVTFKACRGDVFYVQEGTGLRVRVGDLVIVEADRGTDLGTVIAENITWQKAKEMKEQYAKEQYTVLMMYASRRATTPGLTAPAAPGGGNMGGSGGFSNGNGAMPNHGQQQGQEAAPAELKPKMIKRLAQPHEIQTLRDKEANEAKAKRVCQQKVLEHRLPMEILDAEFQMDWKKLTFYYFADSYINFNSLVTDLFKVYKTRIWMSAMNPASFAHPGLQPPGTGLAGASGSSNGLGPIGETAPDQSHSQFGGLSQGYGGYQPATSLSASTAPVGAPRVPHSQQTGQQASHPVFPSRHSPHSLGPQEFGPMSQQNGYNTGYGNAGAGHGPQLLYSNGDGHGQPRASDTAWLGLQSLSLNSH